MLANSIFVSIQENYLRIDWNEEEMACP